MMRLDPVGMSPFRCAGFHHIGYMVPWTRKGGSPRSEPHPRTAGKGFADNPPLFFRRCDVPKVAEKFLNGIQGHQVRTQVLLKPAPPTTLILAHQSRIHKDRRKLIAHRFLHQRRRYTRIHAAAHR